MDHNTIGLLDNYKCNITEIDLRQKRINGLLDLAKFKNLI